MKVRGKLKKKKKMKFTLSVLPYQITYSCIIIDLFDYKAC